jgi:hypothetical protein
VLDGRPLEFLISPPVLAGIEARRLYREAA